MENSSAKRRGWIKNIAIIFLVVLLLLTFFSNTILTYSLPEVSAQYPKYDSLSSTVKMTGSVKANASYKVVYEQDLSDELIQTKKVASVYVREGDTVEKDQVILSLVGGASNELQAAKEEYEALKKQYELSKIDNNVSYLQSNQQIKEAETAYTEAKESLEKMKKQYETLTKDSSSAEVKKRMTELTNEIAALESEIADIESKIAMLKSGQGSGDTNASVAEMEYKSISTKYLSLKAEVEKKAEQLKTRRKNLEDMRTSNGLTNEIASLRQSYYELISSESPDMTSLSDTLAKISEAEAKLKIVGIGEVSDVALFAEERAVAELEETYNELSEDLTALTADYETAKTAYETAESSRKNEAEIAALEAKLADYKTEKESLSKELEGLSDPEELEKQIKEAEKNVDSLKNSLDILKQQTWRSNKETANSKSETEEKLAELEEQIEAYENAPETTAVVAPISGRVVNVYKVAGDTVSSGETVADIEIADKGYTVEVTVTADEARKVAVGSPVSISNSWWYSNIEASITKIRADVTSQGKNKVVVFEVKGDVYEGQQLTFAVGDKSASYDCVLPNSAIREDNNGKYVLTVESKKTALGMKYTAKRTDITVVASDDTKSAVDGLYGSEFVITNATTPIADGQRVRLAEN